MSNDNRSSPGIPGPSAFIQTGGFERNKFTGHIDWIPMTGAVQTYRQAVQRSGLFQRGSGCFRHWIPWRRALDPACGLPSAWWVDGRFRTTGYGNWEFLNFLDSQGATYAIPLADANSPGTVNDNRYALAADGGWPLLGALFTQ
jgi:hypothetical protein